MIIRSPYPDVDIPDRPLSDFVFENLARRADKPALIDGPSGRTLTYAQVHAMARRVANALVAKGFRKGDVFAILSPNLPEYAVAFHGVAMAGGVVTTASPLTTPADLANQLKDSGARYLLTIAPLMETARHAAQASRVEEILVFGEAEGATPFASLLAGSDATPDVRIDPANDLIAMPYSSGTTGRVKGVMLTHRNMVAALRQFALIGGNEDFEGHVTIAFLPFFHIYGLTVIMNLMMQRGMTCVTMPRFDLEQFLQLIERHRPSALFVVPPVLVALAKHPLVAKYDMSSVEFIGSGAAPLGEDLQRLAGERMNAGIRQGYGMTETAGGATSVPRNDPDPPAGSVGRLLPNLEARLLDASTGLDAEVGEKGELLLRGPNIMRGYFGNLEATDATIDADGWLHTGDVATVDAQGYIFIVDRLKELIKVNAYQVAPAQLEAILLTHPGIADAAVIGIADEETGEAPKAFVVKRSDTLDETQVMEHVAAHVAPYARLRAVEFIDAIPKSPSGKILRRALRERPQA